MAYKSRKRKKRGSNSCIHKVCIYKPKHVTISCGDDHHHTKGKKCGCSDE